MQTIIVPFDFSEYAESALDFAIQMSKKNDGEIKLIHVIEYPMGATFNVSGEFAPYDPMDKVFTLELIDGTKKRLQEVVDQYGNPDRLEIIMMMGSPYDGITSQIEELNGDLIVMGTKGATGLKEFFIGSNTEKVVRNARCPVIAIHEKCDLSTIKNIVFASDLDDTHGKVLDQFKAYQMLFEARLHLIWVDTPHNSENKEVVLEKLEAIAKEHQLENYETHISKAFYAEEGILSYSWQIDADMIALSTHSHKGLVHMFVGSVAEDVVNHSSIPVWTCTLKD